MDDAVVQVLGNSYFGIAIGFYHIFAQIAGGGFSTSVLNPAIGKRTIRDFDHICIRSMHILPPTHEVFFLLNLRSHSPTHRLQKQHRRYLDLGRGRILGSHSGSWNIRILVH